MTAATDSAFDALQMTYQIDKLAEGSTATEIHVMCYLASMLHSFAPAGADKWGYDFSATGAGAPFSPDLENAITQLHTSGHLKFDGAAYSLSETGEAMRVALTHHSRFAYRTEFLESAANTALAMTLPMATGAVMLEPQLASATTIAHRRRLLDRAGLAVLDPYFAGLREQVAGNASSGNLDLFSAAVLWLKYLRRAHEAEVARAV